MQSNEAIFKIDQNFNLHATKIPEQCSSMQVVNLGALSFVDSSLSCDTFNIIHIKNGELATRENIENAVCFFKNKEHDFCLWINTENLTPPVINTLKTLNLTEQNQEVGMLLSLEEYQPVEDDNHANISRVSTPNELLTYANAIAMNWSPPDQNVLAYYKKAANNYLNQENVVLLTYEVDGKVVSTVELFASDEETIGLYGFTTLQTYRGLGIGSSLMTYSLNLVKSKGYKNAILQATEDGLGIYRTYGFKDFTTYFEFSW
mgnify:CR=1 FL=1